MQLGSPNLTWKCSTMSPGNHLFWDQKVKGQGHESQKHRRRGSLHSCEWWLLPDCTCHDDVDDDDDKQDVCKMTLPESSTSSAVAKVTCCKRRRALVSSATWTVALPRCSPRDRDIGIETARNRNFAVLVLVLALAILDYKSLALFTTHCHVV